MSKLGAQVNGIDGNAELIRYASTRAIRNASFIVGDISSLDQMEGQVDGIWSSFTAAYFPNRLQNVLQNWKNKIRPGGWIALTEVDDLFGHNPICDRSQEIFDTYVANALLESRYDFRLGGKLADFLKAEKFKIAETLRLAMQNCPSRVLRCLTSLQHGKIVLIE